MGFVSDENSPAPDPAPSVVLVEGDWVTFPVGRGRSRAVITKIDGDKAELRTVTQNVFRRKLDVLVKTDAP